jgi:hypothetical protein
MPSWRSAHLSWVLLALLLGAQSFLVFCGEWPVGLGGDEPGYVQKAVSFIETGRFPAARPDLRLIEDGELLGWGDWQPYGYPLFVAAANAFRFDASRIRLRTTFVQFALASAVLLVLHGLVIAAWPESIPRFACACILGAQPWSYEYVRSVVPDSATASTTTAGLIALGAFVSWNGPRSIAALFAGSLLLSSAFLLRPEVIVLAPILVGVAILVRGANSRAIARFAAWGAAPFAIIFLTQIAYRWSYAGRPQVFGRFVSPDRAAYDWVHTWFGTEHEMYDFVYGLPSGQSRVDRLPERAFASDGERRRITYASDLVALRGHSWESEAIFREVADRRIQTSWLLNCAAPRVWRTLHLWLNLETNEQLLRFLGQYAPRVRRPLLGAVLAFKAAILSLGLLSAPILFRRRAAGQPRWVDRVTFLMIIYVLLRTALIGVVLGYGVHRYMLTAWPSMLWSACYCLGNVRVLLRPVR